jgi:hypothetical protein
MGSPAVFPIAPHFNPTCFAQNFPLLTYVHGPKGKALYLPTESSILGNFHSFNFFLQWTNQVYKKSGGGSHKNCMYDRSGTEETLKVLSKLTQQNFPLRMEQMIPASDFSG